MVSIPLKLLSHPFLFLKSWTLSSHIDGMNSFKSILHPTLYISNTYHYHYHHYHNNQIVLIAWILLNLLCHPSLFLSNTYHRHHYYYHVELIGWIQLSLIYHLSLFYQNPIIFIMIIKSCWWYGFISIYFVIDLNS